MALIADSGAVYALYDADDRHHAAVAAVLEEDPGPVVVPVATLAEIDYLLREYLGGGRRTTVPEGYPSGGLHPGTPPGAGSDSMPRTRRRISRSGPWAGRRFRDRRGRAARHPPHPHPGRARLPRCSPAQKKTLDPAACRCSPLSDGGKEKGACRNRRPKSVELRGFLEVEVEPQQQGPRILEGARHVEARIGRQLLVRHHLLVIEALEEV